MLELVTSLCLVGYMSGIVLPMKLGKKIFEMRILVQNVDFCSKKWFPAVTIKLTYHNLGLLTKLFENNLADTNIIFICYLIPYFYLFVCVCHNYGYRR